MNQILENANLSLVTYTWKIHYAPHRTFLHLDGMLDIGNLDKSSEMKDITLDKQSFQIGWGSQK